MIYLFILILLAESSIVIPLHKQSNSSPENHPFPFRGLSYPLSITNYINVTFIQYQYYIYASIGTPPQSFSMLVSLKYSWVFINKNNCTHCRSWSKKFDSSNSSTFRSQHECLQFDSVGPSQGCAGLDTVYIAEMAAKYQRIILVDTEWNFNLMPDGVFGLGFYISSHGAISIISTLYQQKSISHMIFSIYINDLNSLSDLPNYGDSMLIIDGHNISKYAAESDFTYIKASDWNGFWRMKFDMVLFDKINITSGYNVIISPETNFIHGPKDDINTILKRLHNNYGCKYDKNGILYCKCTKNYPDLTIKINGVKFRIKSTGYLIKTDNVYCVPLLNNSTIENTWILGDTFLRRFYTLYDIENMKIGFATVGNTSQISINNSTSGSSSGSGSFGNSSGDSGSSGSSAGSGSSSYSEDSDNRKSSSSICKDSNFLLAISISGFIFIVWVSSLVFLYIKIRESKKDEAQRIEAQRKGTIRNLGKNINIGQNLRGKEDAIAEQKRLQQELKIIDDNAEAEERRLKQKLKLQSENAQAEKKRLEEEIKRKNNDAIAEQQRIEQEIEQKNKKAIEKKVDLKKS